VAAFFTEEARVIDRRYASRVMTTEHFVVLSALAPDRPGLVADLTSYVTERGGNVEESRMLILGAEFGILVLVSGSSESVDAILRDVKTLEASTGAGVMARRTKSPEEHRRGERKPVLITAESFDRVGIVRAIASAIQKIGLNIVDLETTAVEAPFTGATLFKIEVRIDAPRGTTIAQIRDAMEAVAAQEKLDVEVKSLA
jgi:glycine cleavage system transcriptional repressor